MQEFHDIWEPILQALAEHVNSSTIMKLWFNPLQLAAFSDTTAVIIAESNLKKNIIIVLNDNKMSRISSSTVISRFSQKPLKAHWDSRSISVFSPMIPKKSTVRHSSMMSRSVSRQIC